MYFKKKYRSQFLKKTLLGTLRVIMALHDTGEDADAGSILDRFTLAGPNGTGRITKATAHARFLLR